jgi:hypothetical protein
MSALAGITPAQALSDDFPCSFSPTRIVARKDTDVVGCCRVQFSLALVIPLTMMASLKPRAYSHI